MLHEGTDPLTALVQHEVVVDLAAAYVAIGTLVAVDEKFLTLQDVDLHDLRDSSTTRDLYVLDAARHGINANRRQALVVREQMVFISRLSDVNQ